MKEHRIKKYDSNLELLALSELNKTYFGGFFYEYFLYFFLFAVFMLKLLFNDSLKVNIGVVMTRLP